MTRRLRENDKGRLQITCLFEELLMQLAGEVVSKESASFEGYTAISIHANHRDMVKFATAEDDGFVMVLGELKRWVKTDRYGSLDPFNTDTQVQWLNV
jgi:hypothetical protein